MVVLPTLAISLSGSTTAPIGSVVTVNATVTGAVSSYSIKWMNKGVLFATTTVPYSTYTKTMDIDSITAIIIPVSDIPCYDSAKSAVHIITNTTTGISLPSSIKEILNIYPNPVTDVLNIDNVMQQTSYRILNMVGSVMQQGVLKAGNNSISIQSLSIGMYMLQLTGNEGEKTVRKIVKQ